MPFTNNKHYVTRCHLESILPNLTINDIQRRSKAYYSTRNLQSHFLTHPKNYFLFDIVLKAAVKTTKIQRHFPSAQNILQV